MSMPPTLHYAPPPARDDIREIAIRQRLLMYAILGYLGMVVVYFIGVATHLLPLEIVGALGYLAAVIFAIICVGRLATSLYGLTSGILLGIGVIIPLVGLIVLLSVSSRATAVLRRNGYKVGLMGANPNQPV